eukprot:TRINITY_DN39214_c0_g1_i1.p1 TRINITY_DN39214_c0_g1~~TRINITY_DN39214_c0_g1_i1.p1  ORF type:complete len:108 (+),score=6.30 TRINITY_DN39214_c0_g1_i1:84-407(+)
MTAVEVLVLPVTEPLNYENWRTWSFQMDSQFEARSVSDHVFSEAERPAAEAEEGTPARVEELKEQKIWDENERAARSCIRFDVRTAQQARVRHFAMKAATQKTFKTH